MKKIFLIGKTGQLGGELVKDAESFGFEIVGFNSKELNVLDTSKIKKKIDEINPDILINTSAYNVVPRCEDNPTPALKTNFIAVRDLAIECKKRNIIFVTYSTDYVFDGEKNSPYKENNRPNPLQVYGLSKLAGEDASLSVYPENSFIIRTCGVYGGEKGSPQKGGNFVLNIIKESIDKVTLDVSCEQIVSPTYAGDLSKATLKLLVSKNEPGIYHLVNEGYCSWYEFTKEIFRLRNIDIKLNPVDRSDLNSKMKRPKFSALKNTKAKILGIELPSWQEGLKSYLNFLNSHGQK